MADKIKSSIGLRGFIFIMASAAVAFVVLGYIFGPVTGSIKKAKQSGTMMAAHALGVALHDYAQEHAGKYPEGKSSTEIFQILFDEQYITDPSMFSLTYLKIPGKVPYTGGKLKPENVTWDVTCCVDSSAPDGLPLVFVTGYKISYVAGAKAVPAFPHRGRSWFEWLAGKPDYQWFMAVCNKGNMSRVILPDEDGSIPNFIPADFDSQGKTYRQLTP